MTSVPRTVLVELGEAEAEALRHFVAATEIGWRPEVTPLIKALEAAGIVAPSTARCPDIVWDGMVGAAPHRQCDTRCSSEDQMYQHLRFAHRYPEEDAGSSAARAWRTR